MRFIDKRSQCKPLQQRKHNRPKTDIEAKKAWRRFNKQAIRKACYKQQLGLCAYTELALDDPILGNHLEHIAPRSKYPERTFDEDNIILAAMDECYSGKLDTGEKFGGHFKKALYSDEWFIGPFNPRCESHFYYCSTSGLVLANPMASASEQLNATKTITTLNLNCGYLTDLRQEQLKALTEDIKSTITSSPEKFSTLKLEILRVKEKRLPVFYSAKKQLFNRMEEAYFENCTPPNETTYN